MPLPPQPQACFLLQLTLGREGGWNEDPSAATANDLTKMKEDETGANTGAEGHPAVTAAEGDDTMAQSRDESSHGIGAGVESSATSYMDLLAGHAVFEGSIHQMARRLHYLTSFICHFSRWVVVEVLMRLMPE